MDEILTAQTLIGGIVLAATSMIKSMVVENYTWLPLINVVVGVAIGVLYAVTILGGDVATLAWAGALSGFVAGGFYDAKESTKALNNQRQSDALIGAGNGEQDNRDDEGGA